MGLAINRNAASDVTGCVSLFLSSLMLIDIAYISSCNVRENKVISLFCGLLSLHGWYILLSARDNDPTGMIFAALSPVIWYVSINFILIFLFQGSGYQFKKAVNICLTGTCICSLTGLLVSNKIFVLFYGILLSADLSKHRGLSLITDRVGNMDGSVKITDNFPHGICIQITLPMKGDVSYQYFISR